jgi:hypothetical protein
MSKTFEEELNAAIVEIARQVSLMPRGKTISANMFEERDVILAAHQAEMDRVVEDVIGEVLPAVESIRLYHRNDLRKEQRARYKAIKEGK